jgi:hypothetical protein
MLPRAATVVVLQVFAPATSLGRLLQSEELAGRGRGTHDVPLEAEACPCHAGPEAEFFAYGIVPAVPSKAVPSLLSAPFKSTRQGPARAPSGLMFPVAGQDTMQTRFCIAMQHFLADFERNGTFTGFPSLGIRWQRMESQFLRLSNIWHPFVLVLPSCSLSARHTCPCITEYSNRHAA